MRILNFCKSGVYLKFGITEENKLIIIGIGEKEIYSELSETKFFTPVEIHTTGSNPDDHHGAKHTGSDELFYVEHIETDRDISFVLKK